MTYFIRFIVKHSVCFTALLFFLQGQEPMAADVFDTVEIITPSKVNRGREFPIAVYAKNRDGTVSVNISGEFELQTNSTTPLHRTITLKKGVGYLTAAVQSDSAFSIYLRDLQATKTIDVIDSQLVTDHRGELQAGGELWDAATEHHVYGDFIVPEKTDLVISDGARIVLHDLSSLIVYGSISAEGTSENPVVFSSDESGNPWGGIEIKEGNGDFSYCFFTHGGADPSRVFGHSDSQPVLKADHAALSLSNCFLFNNIGKGIGGYYSRIKIDSSLIAMCDTEKTLCIWHLRISSRSLTFHGG